MLRILTLVLVVISSQSLIGCGCTDRARAREIVVDLSDSVNPNDVELDFVFVNSADAKDWKSKDANKWFAGVDPDRANVTKLSWSPGVESWSKREVEEQTGLFASGGPLLHLVIFAQLPGNGFDMEMMDLNKCVWSEAKVGGESVRVRVEETRIRAEPGAVVR